MALGIDGLVSGLDTTSLINSLMAAEATPQTLLKRKATTTQSTITALQTLNAQIAALAETATKAGKPASLDLFTATTTGTGATAKAGTGAAPGQIELVVGATARAQVAVSAAVTRWPAEPPVLTLTDAKGTRTELTPASSSLDDVVAAVNASSTGVKAVKVASGKDASGEPQYRLQFSAAATGTAGAFQVHVGTEAQTAAGEASDLFAAPGASVTTAARDASVTLWAGTAAEQVVTSSTNSFTGLLPGVDVTVTAASADPVTVTVGRDAGGSAKVASGLVSSVNAVLAAIASGSKSTTSTSSTGTSTLVPGTFSGQSTVRDTGRALTTATSLPIDGTSPSALGITIQRDGTFAFDETVFQAALAADPAGTQAKLTVLAERVAGAASTASDKTTGTITTVITGQQSVVKDIGVRVTDWDSRLAARREQLTKTYSALEVQLSNLQSQSNWLSGQISSLAASSGGQ